MNSSHPSDTQVTIRLWALCGAVAFRLAAPVTLFVLLGIFFDKRLGTLPFLTITAIPVSFLLSLYLIKRDLMHASFIEPKKGRQK